MELSHEDHLEAKAHTETLILLGHSKREKQTSAITAYGIFSLGYLEAFNLLAATWKAAQKQSQANF